MTLSNVHVRYEDNISNPDYPFACGVMIESFRFHTTDAEGNDVFVDRSIEKASFTHKALSLTRLGVYWDRLPRDDTSVLLQTRGDIQEAMRAMIQALQDTNEVPGSKDTRLNQLRDWERRHWILQPASLAVQLTKNESHDYSIAAKYSVQAKIGSLDCNISREQYEDIMFLNKAFLGRRVVEAHFASARRRPFHRPTIRAREWWDYAVRLVLVHKSRVSKGSVASTSHQSSKMTLRTRYRWSSMARSVAELRLYKEAFRMELRSNAPLDAGSKYGEFKTLYEATYPVDVIMAARDAAEEDEIRELKRKKLESARAATTSAQQGGSSWYSYFFGASSETGGSETDDYDDGLDDILTAEGKADLKEAYDQVVEKESGHSVPKGCNLFSVKLQLTQGSLKLFQAGHLAPFTTATLTGSVAVNVQPFGEWDARFRLQHFEILNSAGAGTPFHTFCTLSPAASASDRRLPCMSFDAKMERVESVAGSTTDGTTSAVNQELMKLQVRFSCMSIRLMADPAFVFLLHHFFVSLVPDEQLEKVWVFATSSVSDWFFSEREDEDASMSSMDANRRRMVYDVLVDVNAPVIVVPENPYEATGSVLVVDFGKLSFRTDDQTALAADKSGSGSSAEASVEPAVQQLSWRLTMQDICVLLGRREKLTWTDDELHEFSKLVEELSLEFSIKTPQQTSRIKQLPRSRPGTSTATSAAVHPQLEIHANLPGVFISISEEQLIDLGRIHSTISAGYRSVRKRTDYLSVDETPSTIDDNTSIAQAQPSPRSMAQKGASNTDLTSKHIMKVKLSLGEIAVNVRESAVKDAFLVQLRNISLNSSVFESHYTFEAKLRSLVMQDMLYDSDSKYRDLIATGSLSDEELISVTVIGITVPTREVIKKLGAEASGMMIDVRCHVVDVQWNPSSMALLYRIGSAYASALQVQSDFETFSEDEVSQSTERIPEQPFHNDSGALEALSSLPTGAETHGEDQQMLPVVLLRASLVQLGITFNKDQINRQLVRLAMKDSAIEIQNFGANGLSAGGDTLRAAGHVGNFVATDLSMKKHPLYSSLVGLDERELFAHEGNERGDAKRDEIALVVFSFASGVRETEKSTVKLEFRPIRVVYFHQQILELVDYLMEGVMGTMVNKTLANATQLLLSESESSVVFKVSIAKPSLVLPLRIEDANHIKITADYLNLEHFPSSIVHYDGSGSEDIPRKTISKQIASSPGGVRSHANDSFLADYKEITLVNARVLCTRDSYVERASVHGDDLRYLEVLDDPVGLTICVEDLITSNVRLKGNTSYLPRFTIESEIDQLNVCLSRTSYLSFVGLISENFGADELAGSSEPHPTHASGVLPDSESSDDYIDSLRPTVNYTYMDPDAEQVTFRTCFTMKSLRCYLLNEERRYGGSGPSGVVDAMVNDASRVLRGAHESAFSAVTASQFSFASKQMRDAAPSIEIRVASLTLRDLAGAYLQCDDGAGTKPDQRHGTLVLCQAPACIAYSWDESSLQCQLDFKLSNVTGTVIPEALMAVMDFFVLPTKPTTAVVNHRISETSGVQSPLSSQKRQQSITDILLEANGPEYEMTITLESSRMGIAIPTDYADPSSPTISCLADFSLHFTGRPGRKNGGSGADGGASSDFDIQNSLILDAHKVELVIANVNRQGCIPRETGGQTSYDDHSGDLAATIQIIEPCDLHIEISDLFPHAGQKQQIVALKFTPIDVFISHDDVSLAVETMERLNDSMQQYTQQQSSNGSAHEVARTGDRAGKLRRMSSSGSGILSPRSFQTALEKDAAAGVEVHRYFTLEIGSVCLTVINDCDGCDMGLAQFQLERCNFFLNVTYEEASSSGKMFAAAPATTISGGGSFVVLMSYYNPDTRDWHPMCTEWSMDLSVQGSVHLNSATSTSEDLRLGENELHIILTANHPLEVTITHGLLEVAASAGGAWKRRARGVAAIGSPPESPSPISGNNSPPTNREAREKRKHAPCVIRNETGVEFSFWLTNGRVNTSRQHVGSGDIADLRYTHTVGRGSGVVRKYASAEREAANMRLCVEFVDTSFQPVQGIIFEQLGSRAFPLVDVGGHLSNYSLNCYAKLVDGRILLSISSQIKLVNKLSMPIQLLVNDPTWNAPVEIGVLQPHRESAIPLLLSLGTELRVRPADPGEISTFSWSAPIPVQTRSEVSLKVEAAASGDFSDVRSAIFAVSLTVEQSLRVVSISEPMVFINKLPVPISFAIRNVVMNNQGSGSGNKGEVVGVGSKCGIWWTDQQQRPLFRLIVDGCLPSKWIELVHPRTKSGSVLSVTLERLDGRPFKLLMQVGEDSATKSIHLVFYAEVWFVNRTGLELIYGNEAEHEAYTPPFEARALVGNAQICAYSTFGDTSNGSSSPTVRVGMGSCHWSPRFVADPRRLSWQDEVLTMRGSGSTGGGTDMLYELGVSVDYATRHFGSITTLVSFFPRYLIINRTACTVLLFEQGHDSRKSHHEYTQVSDDNVAHHVLAPGDTYALYWVTGSRSKVRASVLGDVEYEWSGGFSVDHVGTSNIVIPERASGWGQGGAAGGLSIQVEVKRGAISQSSIVVTISETPSDDESTRSSAAGDASAVMQPTWDRLSLHAQVAGVVLTIADKRETDDNLFGQSNSLLSSDADVEEVARVTISRINLETNISPEGTSAKMNLMGLKVEDLLPNSKNPIVMRPVPRNSGSAGAYGGDSSKYFLEMSYLEKPHPKYKWVERVHVELQDVRLTTSMRFVDRINRLLKETVAHFENRSYSSFSVAASSMLQDNDEEDANILHYFVPTASEDDASMTSITGQKIYIESCEIAPVRVVVSFSRGKGDVRQPDPKAGFWLTHLKFKIENACLVLDAFKLTRALATQAVLVDSLTSFYEKSVKSQALGLIDSIQVTSLVTSVVTGGVTSFVSTILGKTDPSLAASSGFRYEALSNSQLINKHSRALEQCQSTTQFLEQVKHLVFDWDSNHTGLEARACVALGILNNSRHSLVINAQLRDGAELRILPLGRRHLASVLDAPRSAATGMNEWRSDRAMVLFAFGYTPTPLTSGDVYFEVRSNACNVFVTRKTARLKANMGYTATFTHQEKQNWWSTNVVIVGDDLHSNASSSSYTPVGMLRQTAPPTSESVSSLFGDASTTTTTTPDAPRRSSTWMDPTVASGEWLQTANAPADAAAATSDEEYELTFTGQALGIIAKQSGRSVIVRECTALPSGAPGPALATGRIAPGDLILTVNGVTVVNTTQFRELVRTGPRPLVLRLRATGARYSAAYDLFGEAKPSPPKDASTGGGGNASDDFNLFG